MFKKAAVFTDIHFGLSLTVEPTTKTAKTLLIGSFNKHKSMIVTLASSVVTGITIEIA